MGSKGLKWQPCCLHGSIPGSMSIHLWMFGVFVGLLTIGVHVYHLLFYLLLGLFSSYWAGFSNPYTGFCLMFCSNWISLRPALLWREKGGIRISVGERIRVELWVLQGGKILLRKYCMKQETIFFNFLKKWKKEILVISTINESISKENKDYDKWF